MLSRLPFRAKLTMGLVVVVAVVAVLWFCLTPNVPDVPGLAQADVLALHQAAAATYKRSRPSIWRDPRGWLNYRQLRIESIRPDPANGLTWIVYAAEPGHDTVAAAYQRATNGTWHFTGMGMAVRAPH